MSPRNSPLNSFGMDEDFCLDPEGLSSDLEESSDDRVLDLDDMGVDVEFQAPDSILGDLDSITEEVTETSLMDQEAEGFESESILAFLLRKADYKSLVALASLDTMLPSKLASSEGQAILKARAQFMPIFSADLSRNRALSWYSRLASKFGSKFKAEGGDLVLEPDVLESSKDFLSEFTKHHKRDLEAISPIQSLCGKVKRALSEKPKLKLSSGKAISYADDLEIDVSNECNSSIDFQAGLLEDPEFTAKSTLRKSDLHLMDDPVFGNDMITDTQNFSVSLSDLSNKAVAQELLSENLSDNALMGRLSKEGFSDTRIAEILAITKFLKAKTSRRSTLLDLPRSEPDTEFRATF